MFGNCYVLLFLPQDLIWYCQIPKKIITNKQTEQMKTFMKGECYNMYILWDIKIGAEGMRYVSEWWLNLEV